jgi:hypothetical protein
MLIPFLFKTPDFKSSLTSSKQRFKASTIKVNHKTLNTVKMTELYQVKKLNRFSFSFGKSG